MTLYTQDWDLTTIPDAQWNSEHGRRRGAKRVKPTGGARPGAGRPRKAQTLEPGAMVQQAGRFRPNAFTLTWPAVGEVRSLRHTLLTIAAVNAINPERNDGPTKTLME